VLRGRLDTVEQKLRDMETERDTKIAEVVADGTKPADAKTSEIAEIEKHYLSKAKTLYRTEAAPLFKVVSGQIRALRFGPIGTPAAKQEEE